MPVVQRIAPCLWFDDQAEEAVAFYTATFKSSRIVARQTFTALNGGPVFRFNEAISFQVNCETQAEVDHYWRTLSDGGDPNAQPCGWLKDKYGVSWQVVPRVLVDIDELGRAYAG